MSENILGEIRRSLVSGWYGPGAIIDFRSDNAPVSAMPAGLEEWDRAFPPKGCLNTQSINEPRLERIMGTRCFRTGPVAPNGSGNQGHEEKRALVAVRFPSFLQCPSCDRIATARSWGNDPGKTYRYCPECTMNSSGGRKIFAIPVRFITACEAGHVDDFPWESWIVHKEDCTGRRTLFLKSERPGLSGLMLSCSLCGSIRSMDGIFSSNALSGYRCRGRRPWLAVPDEPCAHTPRTLQRGASNLYFPLVESSLSIPPWSDLLQDTLGQYWSSIMDVENSERAKFINVLAKGPLGPALDQLGLSPEELARIVEERIHIFRNNSKMDIKEEEYRQFVSAVPGIHLSDREFEIRNTEMPSGLDHLFSKIIRVVRLREVQALKGFTRIFPPSDPEDARICSLSASNLDWLPATEVRGEGIFLALRPEAVISWEQKPDLVMRAQEIDSAFSREWNTRNPGKTRKKTITPRSLLVHTFAHALMRQLALECGYSGASLKERLYVEDGNPGMAGLLIYTSSTDADGTLGGLQRQGERERISYSVRKAIHALEWCSSDPLCIHGMNSLPENMSKAACHACVLVPEISCEEFNRFLDRAMLIGTAEHPEEGYFSSLFGVE